MGRPLYSTTHPNTCSCSTIHESSCPARTTATASGSQPSTSPTETTSEQSTSRVLDPDLVQTLSQSREYLQRVSTAIEAAYERLLSISNRLSVPLERMSNEFQDSQGAPQMGPSHAAIVLSSASQGPNARDGHGTVEDAVAQRLSDPAVADAARRNLNTIRQRFAELTSTIADDSAADPALSDGEPPRPSPTILFGPRSREGLDTRRSLVTSVLMRNRQSNPMDGTTTLGRRVEARASGSRDSLDSRVRDVLADSSFTVTVLNRHREELTDSSRSFNSSGSRESESRSNSTPSVTLQQSETTAARPWATRDRTSQWRENLQERRPTSATSSSSRTTGDGPRLRSLITLPPMPLASPAIPPRQINIDHMLPPDELSDMPGLETETEGERRERLRPSGVLMRDNPLVLSDSSDDDDAYWGTYGNSLSGSRILRPSLRSADAPRAPSDLAQRPAPPSWISFSNSTWGNYDESQSERTAQPYDPMSMRRRRRRGWARLDQDGNEIPTDEEEEYERNRAHMRSRAALLSSRFMNGDDTVLDEMDMPPPPPSRPRLSSVFTPTTRSDSLSFPDDDRYVRINLGPPSLRITQSLPEGPSGAPWGPPRARRSTVSPIRETSTSTPFLASPIPWTSVDLTPTSRPKPRDRRVSARNRAGRAPLAGR